MYRTAVFLALLLFGMRTAQAQYGVGDYGATGSGTWTTVGIWSKWNGAAWVAAGSVPTVASPYANVFILAGHTVALPCMAGPTSVKNITVEAGGKLWTNDCVQNTYLYVYGSTIQCDGQMGDGATFDGLSLGIEGVNVTISGSGTLDCSRIRKDDAVNFITNLVIARDVNVRFSGGTTTQIYNSANTSVFNVTVNAGCTVNLIGTGGQGNLAMDGTNGNDASNRGGSYTINGTINISGTLFLTTNNTANPCSFTINNGGYVRTSSIDMTASGTAKHTLTINAGGTLEVYGTPTAWNAISTTNNICNLNAASTFDYSGSGPQDVEGGVAPGYGTLRISGTGTKAINGVLTVKGDLNIVNTAGTPVLDATILSYSINAAGDWNSYGANGFNERTGQVTFNGTGPQAINTTGGEGYYKVRLAKSAGTVLTMNCDVTAANQLFFFTNGVLDLNGHTLAVTSGALTAITGGTATKYIISESTDNSSRVQWTINTTTGAHLIPFGKVGAYLPFTFAPTGGDAGVVSVSTYGTPANDLPWPATPTAVLNLNSTTGLLPDNRDATVDRFWEVDVTGAPTADLTFTYASGELPVAPYNTPLAMVGQRYNGATDRWEAPLGGQSSSAYAVTVPSVTAFGPWALAATLSPLPIELLSFTATDKGNRVDLDWSTASEQDNDHFTLLRSEDGNEFEPIATVPGAGNSQQRLDYSWTDLSPLPGVSYYILRQTDINGTWNDSPKLAINHSGPDGLDGTSISPNPATDLLTMHPPVNTAVSGVELLDLAGRKVMDLRSDDGGASYVAGVEGLPTGTYLVHVTAGAEQRLFRSVVVSAQ